MRNKKQDLSLFLITMSTSAVTLASTCAPGNFDPNNGSNCQPAPRGSYVPSAGATAALLAQPGRYAPDLGMTEDIPAPPGSFVSGSGATTATTAPIGTYAPNSGMTNAFLAPVGYYVPTTGALEATPVSSGFYTPSTGMANQLPTGGMAAPLTASLQSSKTLQQLSNDLIKSSQTQSLKVALAHQQSTVKQELLTQSQLKTNVTSIALQADLYQSGNDSYGVQASYAHHQLKNPDVSNSGNSYQLGAFKAGTHGNLRYQGTVFAGQTSSDNQRQALITRSSGTTTETLMAKSDVSWYGLMSRFSYPIIRDLSLVTDIGATSYKADALRESGTATLNGSSVTSVASLNTDAIRYTAIPAMLGLSYNLISAGNSQKAAPVVLTVGVIGDLASKQSLAVNLNSSRIYNLPIQQTSTQAGLIKITFNQWELAKDTNLSGTLQTQIGSQTTLYQAGVNVVRKW